MGTDLLIVVLSGLGGAAFIVLVLNGLAELVYAYRKKLKPSPEPALSAASGIKTQMESLGLDSSVAGTSVTVTGWQEMSRNIRMRPEDYATSTATPAYM